MSTHVQSLESAQVTQHKFLNASLWGVQLLLAAAFALAGVSKVTQPLAELAVKMPWVHDVPGALVRFIGAAELAGALGLVLPTLTRIQPRLTVWAARGLLTVMALAGLFHASRGEYGGIVVNAVLGALMVFVAWGRSGRAAIQSR